jgi:hypothetical protein
MVAMSTATQTLQLLITTLLQRPAACVHPKTKLASAQPGRRIMRTAQEQTRSGQAGPPEDLLPALDVRGVHSDHAVKAARPEQGAVQDIWPVGACQDLQGGGERWMTSEG